MLCGGSRPGASSCGTPNLWGLASERRAVCSHRREKSMPRMRENARRPRHGRSSGRKPRLRGQQTLDHFSLRRFLFAGPNRRITEAGSRKGSCQVGFRSPEGDPPFVIPPPFRAGDSWTSETTTYAYVHVCVCVYSYIYIYIYTYIHTYIHTEIYIYIYRGRERERSMYVCIYIYIHTYDASLRAGGLNNMPLPPGASAQATEPPSARVYV